MRFYLLFLVFLLSSMSVDALTGSGTEGDPYQVTNCSDLYEGINSTCSDSAYYILTGDLDCSDYSFPAEQACQSGNAFNGILDGQNYTINNTHATSVSSGRVGGVVAYSSGGTIHHLKIDNLNFSFAATVPIGGVASGAFSGTIIHNVTIQNSYIDSGSNSKGMFTGEFGQTSSQVRDSYAKYCTIDDPDPMFGNWLLNPRGVRTYAMILEASNPYGTKSLTDDSFYNRDYNNNSDSSNAVGLSDSEMKSHINFTNWNFNFTWGFNLNDDYPCLLWEDDCDVLEIPVINGTESDPYIINDCDDLYNLTSEDSAYYSLQSDIDCAAYASLGRRSIFDVFSGVFYGNNHTIRNLNLTASTSNANNGFVQSLDGGSIYDVQFDRCSVISPSFGGTSSSECGIVAGTLRSGLIDTVSVTSSYVECSFDVGAIAGSVNRDDIIEIKDTFAWNSSVYSTVSSGCDTGNYAGGFIARSMGGLAMNISNSYASVDITLRPGCTKAKAFMGFVSGSYDISTGIYYDESVTSYTDNHAVALDEEEFKDSSFYAWENYSDVWRIEDYYYPFFVWMDRINYPPEISINSVEADGVYYDLTAENITIEYEIEDWIFNVTIFDADPVNNTIVLTNSTGIIFSSDSVNESMNISGLSFVEMGNFTLTVNSSDIYGNSSSESVEFSVIDSVEPECMGFEGVLIYNGTNHTIDVTCVDESLYTFNLTCDDGYSHEYTGLTTSYSLLYSDIYTSDVTCSYEVCDGHTKRIIKEMTIDKSVADTISFDGITIHSRERTKAIRHLKKIDRYEMTFEYDTPQTQVAFEVPQWCHYSGSSFYKGWFLCPQEGGGGYWIDFEGDHDVTVNGRTVYVKSRDKSGQKEFRFNSIGKFNCISGSFLIETEERPAFNPGGFGKFISETTCPIDQGLAPMIGYFLVLTLVGAMFFINYMVIKVPIIGLFFAFAFIGVTIPFYMCSAILGMVCTIFGIIMAVVEIIQQ